MWLLALWLGCPKPTPPVQLDADSDRGPRAPLREAIAGPDTWQGAGLCMAIRDGWAGTAGPAPQLLELTHDATGSVVRLQAWPWGTPMPKERAGFTVAFEPVLTRYRTVPLLTPARTYTLSSDDGSLIQGWIGDVDGRLVVAEHQAPFGRTTAGRDAMEGLLGSLRRCADDARTPPSAGR